MAVTESFRTYALEQLAVAGPVTARAMFGGVGVYHQSLFFALLDDDVLYLKVDDSNRPDFEEAGMGPFMPFGDGTHAMQYYEVPADILDDREMLRDWVEKAIDVARRKANNRRRRR